MSGQILVIEDELTSGSLCTVLRSGFQITCCAPAAAVELSGHRCITSFDVVVADFGTDPQKERRGRRWLAAHFLDRPWLFVTAERKLEVAGASEASNLLVERLSAVLRPALARMARGSAPGSDRPHSMDDAILGRSPTIQGIYELVDQIANADVCVLITGESGTGKEVLARTIHARSARKEGPFIAVNCSALPEPLLESELFGHVRGAFTDARTERAGLFARAAGGTLLLDEIGDLSLGLQPKLLRAIQERVVRPVGS